MLRALADGCARSAIDIVFRCLLGDNSVPMTHALHFTRDDKRPLHQSVGRALLDAIRTGVLSPGERVPSTRDLARQLSVSRITVVRAYNDLVSQGFLETAHGKPTRVSRSAATVLTDYTCSVVAQKQPTLKLSPYAYKALETQLGVATSADQPLLNYGAPAYTDLPLEPWRKILSRCAKEYDPSVLNYDSDPLGYYPLRESIAGFLMRARGVRCKPEQVVLFASAQQALDMIARLCVIPGDVVALENPGYSYYRATFAAHDADIRAIDVADDGIEVEQLLTVPPAKIVCVSPSRQDPLGVALSSEKRNRLLSWLSNSATLLIEDDFEGFLCFGTRPDSALQSVAPESVLYLSTFWKVLYPLVASAFTVVPVHLLPAFYAAKLLVERKISLMESAALSMFISDGHLERQIKRLHSSLQEQRQALIFGLSQAFQKDIEILKTSGGSHIAVRIYTENSFESVFDSAMAAALPIVPTVPYYMQRPRHGEYLIGFNQHSPGELSIRVSRMKELLAHPELRDE